MNRGCERIHLVGSELAGLLGPGVSGIQCEPQLLQTTSRIFVHVGPPIQGLEGLRFELLSWVFL